MARARNQRPSNPPTGAANPTVAAAAAVNLEQADAVVERLWDG